MGLVVGEASISEIDRPSSGPPATASQSTTSCSVGAARAGDRRGAAPASRAAAPSRAPAQLARARARGRVSPSSPGASRISSVPRSSSASTISSRKKGLSGDARHELGADRRDAVAHAEVGLDEAHLLLGGEAAQLDAHHALEKGRNPLVGAGRPARNEDRQRIARLQELAEELEAGRSAHCRPSTTTTSGCDSAIAPSRWRRPARRGRAAELRRPRRVLGCLAVVTSSARRADHRARGVVRATGRRRLAR